MSSITFRITTAVFLFATFSLFFATSVQATDYYIAPNACESYHTGCYPAIGNDTNPGTQEQPWKTLGKAWTVLQPGDTLILMDGMYYQSLSPRCTGTVEQPITIRAQHDGQAIIDGQGVRVPVYLAYLRDSYLVIEGIVARNSFGSVYQIYDSNHNKFRRVSGYNANTDGNFFIFAVTGDYNLFEDCVAVGTGRKMMFFYMSEGNTMRRCFADWRQWDGRDWHDCWPWGDGLEIYSAKNNIIENGISYGHLPRAGISLLSQGEGEKVWANNNKILGTMSILAAMKSDGTPMVWGDTRPQPTEWTCVRDFNLNHPVELAGIRVSGSGTVRDNLLQDILSWGSARYGFAHQWTGLSENYGNNRINRASIINNGLDNIAQFGGVGVDVHLPQLELFGTVENSYIENIWEEGDTYTTMEGEGARLSKRYIDGELTNDDLWPWPMEERIKEELAIHLEPEHQTQNFSVTCFVGTVINNAFAQGKVAEGIDMTSRDPNWASDPSNLVVQACNGQPMNTPTPNPTNTPTPSQPGDTDSDGDVDIFDYNNLLTQFGQPPPHTADFSVPLDNDVDIVDYNILLTNFES